MNICVFWALGRHNQKQCRKNEFDRSIPVLVKGRIDKWVSLLLTFEPNDSLPRGYYPVIR